MAHRRTSSTDRQNHTQLLWGQLLSGKAAKKTQTAGIHCKVEWRLVGCSACQQRVDATLAQVHTAAKCVPSEKGQQPARPSLTPLHLPQRKNQSVDAQKSQHCRPSRWRCRCRYHLFRSAECITLATTPISLQSLPTEWHRNLWYIHAPLCGSIVTTAGGLFLTLSKTMC